MGDLAEQIQTTLTAISHLVHAAQTRATPTIRRLTLELSAHDGYPTLASGADAGPPTPFVPVGENASTSSTERHAIAPDERTDDDPDDRRHFANGSRAALIELLQLLDAAALGLTTFCNECDRRTPGLTAVDISRLTCATIPKGACHQWADPTRNDGLCCDHGRAHDLARRTDLLARRALRDRIRYHHTNGTT